MSIRLRLTLWYTGMLAMTLLLFGVGLYFSLSISLYNGLKADLSRQSDEVHSKIETVNIVSPQGSRLIISLPPLDIFQSSVFLQVVNVKGEVESKSSNLDQFYLPVDKTLLEQIKEQKMPRFASVNVGGASLMIHYRPILVNDRVVAVLEVATLASYVRNYLNTFKLIFTFSAFLLVVFAFSLGWFLANRALKPIDHVIAAAEQIEKGTDLDKRILYDGPKDEIGRLTEKINSMLSRIQTTYVELDEAYKTQRRFVSDASHELRTPLTTIRGNVDLLEKMWEKQRHIGADAVSQKELNDSLEVMRDIAAEAERMSRMVNDLLSLARADAGIQVEKEPVPLKPLVEDVARRAQFLPKTAEWRIGDLSGLDGTEVYGNKDYLQQLLFILIDNAFKYTPQGFVLLDAVRMEKQIGLRLQDTGIGMDKDEVPHIFERFYRADPSRGRTAGTGLGLSIAKWIINEHRGSLEVLTRKGEGTTFIVWLPICFPD